MARKTRTDKQREQLNQLAAERLRLARRYAFRMRPHILRWQQEGLTQREIVARLNECGAVVPSEYTGAFTRPTPRKQWTLVQYQRFLKHMDVAAEKMAWYAKGKRLNHARPFGEGAGLFADPLAAGLDFNPNHDASERHDVVTGLEAPTELREEIKEEDYPKRFPLDWQQWQRYGEIFAQELTSRLPVARRTPVARARAEEAARKAAWYAAWIRLQEEHQEKMKDRAFRRQWNREQRGLVAWMWRDLEARQAKKTAPKTFRFPDPPSQDEWRQWEREFWRERKRQR